MAGIGRFEDIVAWQKARALTKEIYLVTASGGFAKDFGLRDQIRRASVSVMANIAEGFERAGRAEFHQFLVVAKASCAEVRSHLYVALDAGYITEDLFRGLSDMTEEVGKIIGGLRRTVDKDKTKS